MFYDLAGLSLPMTKRLDHRKISTKCWRQKKWVGNCDSCLTDQICLRTLPFGMFFWKKQLELLQSFRSLKCSWCFRPTWTRCYLCSRIKKIYCIGYLQYVLESVLYMSVTLNLWSWGLTALCLVLKPVVVNWGFISCKIMLKTFKIFLLWSGVFCTSGKCVEGWVFASFLKHVQLLLISNFQVRSPLNFMACRNASNTKPHKNIN